MSATQNQSMYAAPVSFPFDLQTTTTTTTEDVCWSLTTDAPTSIEESVIVGATHLRDVYDMRMSDLHSTPVTIQPTKANRPAPCPLAAPASVHLTVAVAA
ncbi:hypothetical protein SDRG_08078 [Saprolegnia diclina VS20]|uniref:Uncharacterized protein n=1 Tax=Saprolegnia diclina (strain VS20) TaxID=1156394 RepID=T0QKI2_SAPDV|nr:hypothetical protein SDRG_08078 [Saprolegnia diclina VS20]EQC34305.1 hypothetical protein SDRG_08078 [Saprolegnia diclina VS20]|eukprot:XP_008612167.1 hypothetical protein SDRG_08078 [Saprolegnia diclina VS20]